MTTIGTTHARRNAAASGSARSRDSRLPASAASRATHGELRSAIYEGDRQLRRASTRFGDEIRELRLGAGLSQAAIARAIGVSRSVICELEAGQTSPTVRVRARVAAVLGAEFRMAAYAQASPLIFDAAQARIVEMLVATCHPSWRAIVEAPIPGPGRRSSDLRLERATDVVLVEVETRVRRWEEIMRELHDKRASVAGELAKGSRCHCVLVLPETRHHRALVRAHPATIRAAFPADPRAVRDALTRVDDPWPGDGILWVSAGREPRISHGTPMTRQRPPGVRSAVTDRTGSA